MGVEVDSVIVDLEARIGQYRTDMREAIGLQREYQQGWKTAPANNNAAQQAPAAVAQAEEQATAKIVTTRKKRTDAEKAAAAEEKQAAKEAAAAVKATEKERADAAKAAAKERSDAAKATAKAEAEAAKQIANAKKALAAEEARLAVASRAASRTEIENLERLKAAEREASNQAKANAFLTGSGNRAGIQRSEIASVFDRATLSRLEAEQLARETAPVARAPINLFSDYDARQAARGAGGAGIGATVGGRADAAAATDIMRQTRVGGAQEEVAAEREVNAALVEQTRLQAGLTSARGEDRRLIREQLADMRTFNQLLRTGLTEEEAAVQLDGIRVARARELAAQQAATARAGGAKNLRQAVEGATIGYGPSGATLAGIAAAAGVGIGVEAVKSATDYARALTDVAKAAGISTTALQVYQHAAVDAGGKSTDFDTAISQLSENLGKARTGAETQGKAFAALGINIKNASTAGDLMPTLIDRISSISDQSKRAAVETALFGESGRKLDGLLSGGNQKINDLAAALERTGAILSSSDIAKLDEVSKKLEAVKAQLQVDVAQVVAGNADAILKLADSFATLVDEIGKAVTAYDRFANSPIGKLLSGANNIAGTINPLNGIGSLVDRLGGSKGGKTATQVGQQGNSVSLDLGDVQSGKVNNKLLDSLNAPKGRKGKSADQLANEADERTKRFNDLMARYQDEQLAAVAQQTADEEERRQAQRDAIDRDSARQIADLKTQAGIDTRKAPADARLIKARLEQAISAEQAAAQEKKNVVNLEGNASAIDRDVAAQNAILEFKNQQLQAQEQLAETAAERRDLELQILANEQQIAANSANGVLRKAAQGVPTSDADIAAANRTLANQPADTAAKTAVIDRQTQGPLAAYIESLPKSAKEVDEAFQDAAVHGLQGFNSELGQSVAHMLKLHGIAGQFLEDIIQIGIKWEEAQLFGGGSGGSGGGIGGFGSLLGSIGKLFGAGGSSVASSGIGSSIGGSFLSGSLLGGPTSSIDLLSLPGLAGGGSIGVLGNGGIDRNVMSINGQPVARINHGETINVVPTNQRVNGAGGGPMTLQQTIHIDGRNSVTPSDFAGQILSASYDHANKVAAQAGASAVRASPAQVRKSQVLKG